MQIMDRGANQILSITTTEDNELKRPRPLMMTMCGEKIRFYSGKDYVTAVAK